MRIYLKIKNSIILVNHLRFLRPHWGIVAVGILSELGELRYFSSLKYLAANQLLLPSLKDMEH